MTPLYEAVFEQIGVDQGTELLDAGCGAGLAAQIAAGRGAIVSGFDATVASAIAHRLAVHAEP